MKEDIYAFDEVYKCECDSHFLRITQFKDEPQVSFSKFSVDNTRLDLFTRIKLAVGFVFNPAKYDIHGDLIFNFSTAKKISRDLLKVTQDKPKNFVTGA